MQSNNDIFNPFVVEMSVDIPSRGINVSTGNDTVEDLSGFPFVTATGFNQIQVSRSENIILHV